MSNELEDWADELKKNKPEKIRFPKLETVRLHEDSVDQRRYMPFVIEPLTEGETPRIQEARVVDRLPQVYHHQFVIHPDKPIYRQLFIELNNSYARLGKKADSILMSEQVLRSLIREIPREELHVLEELSYYGAMDPLQPRYKIFGTFVEIAPDEYLARPDQINIKTRLDKAPRMW